MATGFKPFTSAPQPLMAFTGSAGAPTLIAVRPGSRPLQRSSLPPNWVLVLGALVCSNLGAVVAIAYANHAGLTDLDLGSTKKDGALMVSGGGAQVCPDDMVLIQGGSFFMGSDSSHPALRWATPAHRVQVSSFCLGKHEVNVDQYTSCVRNGNCEPAHRGRHDATPAAVKFAALDASEVEQCNTDKPGRGKHPINCVSFHQAERYCAANGSRLASEAEWEFAARGADGRVFPWGNTQPSAEHMNACGHECERSHRELGQSSKLNGLMYEEDDGYAATAPVGSFPLGSTRDGVMDLIGNVFEWTSDGLYSYTRDAQINPAGPRHADSHVIRGGSFNSALTEFSDPALRFGLTPGSYSEAVGFRCASDPAPMDRR